MRIRKGFSYLKMAGPLLQRLSERALGFRVWDLESFFVVMFRMK